jgi:hypothetical protein
MIDNVNKTEVEILKIFTNIYDTNKGWINKNYCFCNSATAKVGDKIEVRTNFLQKHLKH